MYARDGHVTHRLEIAQTMTSWDRVFHLLKAALRDTPYHRGKELRRVEQGAGVMAHFADGSSAEADFLVGADGIRSTVRRQYLPELAPLYAGYAAWRGLVAEQDFPPALHAQLFEDFSFCLPSNEQMLGYPVAGPDNDLREGHRRYNFVWYRPASEDEELPRLLTDETGRTHVLSIPPPLVARDVVARMRGEAAQVLAPQFNEMLALCALPFLQPIYDLEVPHMAFGRVAILGDAAFVARPHVGAGVAKAADDALALADALDEWRHRKRPEAVRSRASADRQQDHRARAPSRRLRAGGSQDAGRARLRRTASQARSGVERNRDDELLSIVTR